MTRRTAMKRFTIIAVEHDGTKCELAYVDRNADAIVKLLEVSIAWLEWRRS
jgi:hypothetical protein